MSRLSSCCSALPELPFHASMRPDFYGALWDFSGSEHFSALEEFSDFEMALKMAD